jgi:hypothetical protein
MANHGFFVVGVYHHHFVLYNYNKKQVTQLIIACKVVYGVPKINVLRGNFEREFA